MEVKLIYSSTHDEYTLALHVSKFLPEMVRVRMSARVYPPSAGTAPTLGVRVRYPAPWAQMPTEIRKQWRIVTQEVEKPRLHQALKAKRDEAVCILWDTVLGCGW